MLVEGYEGMQARASRMPAPERPRLVEAAGRVARAYEDRGRPDRAAIWKASHGLADPPADVFAPAR